MARLHLLHMLLILSVGNQRDVSVLEVQEIWLVNRRQFLVLHSRHLILKIQVVAAGRLLAVVGH